MRRWSVGRGNACARIKQVLIAGFTQYQRPRPPTQIAASSLTADRPVTQAQTTGESGSAAAPSTLPGAPPENRAADIDKIAQDVFEQICRMLDVARERSGDPWQR